MHEQRRTGSMLVGCLIAIGLIIPACADEPTSVRDETKDVGKPQATETDEQPPPDPTILWSSTDVSFYDGSWGGGPKAEVMVSTRYRGNRASHEIDYSATSDDGQGVPSRTVREQQNAAYSFSDMKVFDTHFYSQLPTACGITMHANSTHDVWWEVPFPAPWPNWQSGHAIDLTGGSASAPACAPPPPPCPEDPPDDPPMDESAPMRPFLTCGEGGGGGGGSGGGGYWVTVTECWGYHVYEGGVYQYSVVEGCDQYSYFVAEE